MSLCNKIRNVARKILHGRGGESEKNPAEEISSGPLYPNCDLNVWLRSCEQDIQEPIRGVTRGTIPEWIQGSLLRNGPGKIQYEKQRVNHLFDAAGIIHKFSFCDGIVTYQCRFIRSKSYVRNTKAQQLVVPEFTTPAAPDPCKTIFHRISSLFVLDQVVTDNSMISVYPINDEYYAFAESPFAHRIDPVTIETISTENSFDSLKLTNQTSHPHIGEAQGSFNVGQVMDKGGPSYVVVNYPPGEENPLRKGRIVARVPCRWMLDPCYMHSFSITRNYFVLIEQPLSVPTFKILSKLLKGKPLIGALKWRPEKTLIRLINRESGRELLVRYETETLFFLHTINAFETDDDQLILDICCYKDPKMIDCMYIEALQKAQQNPDYANMFRGRPKRFVLPLPGSRDFPQHVKGNIRVEATELAPLGCETPRINYALYNGKPYRFFYAISSDVDSENPGTLIKVDTVLRKYWTWCEKDIYAAEPVFVPHPQATSEDDGVILSSLLWAGSGINERRCGILVLDARSWTELGRVEFTAPGPVPKCLHGWFANQP